MSKEDDVKELWEKVYCEGDAAFVRQLLELDPKQARSTSRTFTLLHVVAESGDCELARQLLTLGSDVDVSDHRGRTPLHCAAKLSIPDMCQLLIQAGANPTVRDSNGRTPLDLALTGDPWKEPEERDKTIAILEAAQHKQLNP